MKVTFDLPDDLIRQVKLRAVRENRKLKDLVGELLRRGLAAEEHGPAGAGSRVELPLIACAHPARDDEEMTPDRVAELLVAEEADRVTRG